MISITAKSLGRRAVFVAPIRWSSQNSNNVPDKSLITRRGGCPTTKNCRLQPPNSYFCLCDHFSTESHDSESSFTAAVVADVNDLKPFSWSDIIALFLDPNDSDKTHNYIPSDHPNLSLFRRSAAAQGLYDDHKRYLCNNWKSPYDYLVYTKFGKEFGFDKELIKVNPSNNERIKCNSEFLSEKLLVTSPEGFRYQSNPSLSQASEYTVQNGITYLKLVLNDFPYDVETGIQHWCLWKIGGKCRTEGILMNELQWSLQELNKYPFDGVGCSSSLMTKQNELLTLSSVSTMDKFSSFYWVNPPHLQSMPDIHHAHILCRPSKNEGFSFPPPI